MSHLRQSFCGWAAIATALALIAVPLGVQAQQALKVPRIGVLTGFSAEGSPRISALRDGLRELGYVDSQNIRLELRPARGRADQFPDLAAELVRLDVDIIVASNNPATLAAQRATRNIPIVMVHATDPVGLGFVQSLSRPGGNITGLSTQGVEAVGKRVQLLKETIPNLSRLAVLWHPAQPGAQLEAKETEVVAKALGVRLQVLEARSPSEIDSAFVAMTREGAGALLIGSSPLLLGHRKWIVELSAKYRLPTMGVAREYAEAGFLMSYSASITDLYRRSAYFIGRILKGAKPADLPVEQPTKFELVINLKTAKTLGLTIAPSMLARADEVIE